MYKDKVKVKKLRKSRVRKRIRKTLEGTVERPRVFVNKSNRYLYVQVVDDTAGTVLESGSTLEKSFKEKNKNTKNNKAAQLLGEAMAQKLKKKKIQTVVFDRGSYPYHGRIKTLAEAMRKVGMKF